MPVPVRKARESAAERSRREIAERQLADRVRRAKPVPHGPHWYVAARDLAGRFGLDPSEVLDDLAERSAIREYEGGMSRLEAERLALADLEARYTAQVELKL